MTPRSEGRRYVRPVCPICRKRIRRDAAEATTRGGKRAHASCLATATKAGAASAERSAGAPSRQRGARPASGPGAVCGICGRPLGVAEQVQDGPGAVHWACLPAGRRSTPPGRQRRGAPGPAAAERAVRESGAPVITATRAGWCPACRTAYEPRTRLTKVAGVGWIHLGCAEQPLANAEFARNKLRIEAGETYRSRAPSTWRRKSPRPD